MSKQNKNSRQDEKTGNKDVEYSRELADAEDREALARARAATQRVNKDNI
ncbi:YfhD family protein [Salipaludibacillus sp. HK11]